jgi:hypothetical protein
MVNGDVKCRWRAGVERERRRMGAPKAAKRVCRVVQQVGRRYGRTVPWVSSLYRLLLGLDLPCTGGAPNDGDDT